MKVDLDENVDKHFRYCQKQVTLPAAWLKDRAWKTIWMSRSIVANIKAKPQAVFMLIMNLVSLYTYSSKLVHAQLCKRMLVSAFHTYILHKSIYSSYIFLTLHINISFYF